MPSKKQNCDDEPQPAQMRSGAGYVTFKQITVKFPEAKSAGGVLLTAGFVKGANDHTQCIWGRVVKCGAMANRTTCEPFAKEVEQREGFPLPIGTWIVCRNVNIWTLHESIKSLQTHDIVNTFPAEYDWEDVCREIFDLQKSDKE